MQLLVIKSCYATYIKMHLYQKVLRYVQLNFAYKIEDKKHLINLEWGINHAMEIKVLNLEYVFTCAGFSEGSI